MEKTVEKIKIGQKIGKWTIKSLFSGIEGLVLVSCDECEIVIKINVNDIYNDRVKCKCNVGSKFSQKFDCYLSYRRNKVKERIEGKTFGEWKVLKYLDNGVCSAVCKICGVTKEIYVSNLKRSSRCYDCFIMQKYNNVKERIEGKTYINTKVKEYLGKGRCIVLCKICGKEREIYTRYLGTVDRCVDCYFEKEYSSYEMEILEFFSNGKKFKLGKYEIDIYFEEKRFGVEFNGNYWHSDEKIDDYYHWNKTKLASSEGIEIIHIFEYEWLVDKEKIITYLNRKVNEVEQIKVEECKVEEISRELVIEFEDRYNLLGSKQAEINLVLRRNIDEEVVAAVTFTCNEQYEYEVVRITLGEYNIVGGINKIFKYFVEVYNPLSIIAFCDRTKFTGEIFKTLGFNFKKHNGISYNWIRGVEVVSRGQESDCISLMESDIEGEKTERLVDRAMRILGYLKVYNCGEDVYIWIR